VKAKIECPGPALGYMAQGADLLPWLTAEGNAALAAGLNKDIAPPQGEEVADCFEAFGLSGCETKRPHELSGGQQQRVSLMRTLLANGTLRAMRSAFSSLAPRFKFCKRRFMILPIRKSGGIWG
jgi:ABC-type nitrate/sulfonate/bicarbonate transport system ATPase subunit